MLHRTNYVQFAIVKKQVSKFSSNHLTEHKVQKRATLVKSEQGG